MRNLGNFYSADTGSSHCYEQNRCAKTDLTSTLMVIEYCAEFIYLCEGLLLNLSSFKETFIHYFASNVSLTSNNMITFAITRFPANHVVGG